MYCAATCDRRYRLRSPDHDSTMKHKNGHSSSHMVSQKTPTVQINSKSNALSPHVTRSRLYHETQNGHSSSHRAYQKTPTVPIDSKSSPLSPHVTKSRFYHKIQNGRPWRYMAMHGHAWPCMAMHGFFVWESLWSNFN